MSSISVPPYNLNPFTEIGSTAGVANDLTAVAQWLVANKAGGHKMGTCAIHRVVDEDLHVIGVDGLYIADNSIVPAPNRAHSSAAGSALIGVVAGRRIAAEHGQVY